MKNVLLIAALLAFSGPAAANWYQVEIVVFEHLAVETGGEMLVLSDAAPDYHHLPSPQDGERDEVAFGALQRKDYGLAGVYQTLKNSSNYRPLHHTAWRQPELVDEQARRVRIHDADAGLDGAVKLRGGYFLHLDIELIQWQGGYAAAPSVDENESQVFADHSDYVELRESRRIKLNELHYFDHPLLGAIIRVTRLEAEP